MRGVPYSSRADAEAALRALDQAAGLPRDHAEGNAPGDYSIPVPGNAAARIRARGVRTEHAAELVTSPDGRAHALLLPSDARAQDLTWPVGARP